MKPAVFDLAFPENTRDALQLLAKHGDAARILAGGQSLGPMLNMRLVSPRLLIDISRIAELQSIVETSTHIEVGAAVTQEKLRCWWGLEAVQPLLAKLLPWVGHYQTRQRGTVCGSLAHADPSSELPLALRILGGEIIAANRRRRRTLSAADFQTGMMQTALEPDEMIVAARLPKTKPGEVAAFREVAQRHGDFALVATAAIANAETIRLGVAGVADTPQVLEVHWHDMQNSADTLNAFAWQLDARSDAHASAETRRRLVRTLGQSLITEVRDALSLGR